MQGRWTEHSFSLEARSHEWQDYLAASGTRWCASCATATCSPTPRRRQLLFYSIGGAQGDAFFGVPEYVVFPTMLTGPAFFTSVLEGGFHDYPSFERTYHQLRDLLAFVGASLGLVWIKQLDAVLAAANAIGERLDRQMRRGWPNNPDAPLKLREALVALLVHLYRWQSDAAKTARPPNPPPDGARTLAHAAEALALLKDFFRALGGALQTDEEELERHLDAASRREIYADTFVASVAKMAEDPEKEKRTTKARHVRASPSAPTGGVKPRRSRRTRRPCSWRTASPTRGWARRSRRG